MAEVRFVMSSQTPTGPGLIFCDLGWSEGVSNGRWWTWDSALGWFGPIGVDINPRNQQPHRPLVHPDGLLRRDRYRR